MVKSNGRAEMLPGKRKGELPRLTSGWGNIPRGRKKKKSCCPLREMVAVPPHREADL